MQNCLHLSYQVCAGAADISLRPSSTPEPHSAFRCTMPTRVPLARRMVHLDALCNPRKKPQLRQRERQDLQAVNRVGQGSSSIIGVGLPSKSTPSRLPSRFYAFRCTMTLLRSAPLGTTVG